MREIDAALEASGARSRLSVLQSISTLRLLCNHGLMEKAKPPAEREPGLRWDVDAAQDAFDNLQNAEQAYCKACCQDLSSVPSDASYCEDMPTMQPMISQDLDLLCPSCLEGRGCRSDLFLRICNHLPRCASPSLQSSSQPSRRSTPNTDSPYVYSLPASAYTYASSKISSLLQNIMDNIVSEKRYAQIPHL